MPNYSYRCPGCKSQVEIYKSMDDAGSLEKCSCGEVMVRLYEPTQVFVSKGGYNRALGCDQRHAKDMLKKIHDTTGKSFVEAGTESQANITPKLHKMPDTNEVLRDYYATKVA